MEKNHSRSLDGSAVDPRLLPEDWRGLAGFEILVFSDFEWRQIPATQRNAIQDWIIQGGKLVLCRACTSDTPDLPIADGRDGPHNCLKADHQYGSSNDR